MKTYQTNMADQELVVKSLRVLDKIEGGPVREIQKTVEAVRKTQNIQNLQQEQYWKALSDDGIITPIEKQELLRETKSIDRSYVAITQQAQALGIQSSLLTDYTATYNALHNYLYTTLKLFDDMTKETAIDNRDTFNGYFSNYYFAENFVLLAITSGILETMNIRVLESLDEEGEEGETAIYHGGLYQYTSGHWQNITTGAYKGARSQLPADEEGAFFIASDDFYKLEVLIVNSEELYVNGEQLGILGLCRKGYIYYCEEGVWYEESDKTNWRYAAAFADVINITGELPQLFQDSIDALQYEINDLDYELSLKASQTELSNVDARLAEEIATKQGQYTIIGGETVLIDNLLPQIVNEYNEQQTEIDSKISHLPVYYGQTIPNNPQEGDFYLYTGAGQDKGKVRRYHNGAWEWLEDPDLNYEYRNYYMMALQDILEIEEAGSGYFSALFARAFWANTAVVNTLETKVIYLQYGGAIQSSNVGYSEEHYGLRIDYDGNIDANGNVHMGGDTPPGGTKPKVAIGVPLRNNPDFNNYDVVIGGNCKIGGTLDGATGSFSGNLSGATGTFSGVVNAKGFNFSGIEPGNIFFQNIVYDPFVSDIENAYKFIGDGTYRLYIYARWFGIPDNLILKIYKNNVLIWQSQVTSENDGTTILITTKDYAFSYGDIVKIEFTGTSRGYPAPIMNVRIATDSNNDILKILSEPFHSD